MASPTAPPPRPSSTAPGAPSAPASPRRRWPNTSTLRVRLTLKPGQRGTKQLLAQYGDPLLCVRYRYDDERKKRLKTVELIVDERDWEPPPPPFAAHHIVALRVAFTETAVRERVKRAGGTWDPERRVWLLRYDRVVALRLASRIVNHASTAGCPAASGQHLNADARPASR